MCYIIQNIFYTEKQLVPIKLEKVLPKEGQESVVLGHAVFGASAGIFLFEYHCQYQFTLLLIQNYSRRALMGTYQKWCG
jgi:hypothetical protein